MIILVLLLVSIIQNGLALWCFKCSEFGRTQLCDNIEQIVYHEPSDNNKHCIIGFIDQTIMFRVSFDVILLLFLNYCPLRYIHQ